MTDRAKTRLRRLFLGASTFILLSVFWIYWSGQMYTIEVLNAESYLRNSCEKIVFEEMSMEDAQRQFLFDDVTKKDSELYGTKRIPAPFPMGAFSVDMSATIEFRNGKAARYMIWKSSAAF